MLAGQSFKHVRATADHRLPRRAGILVLFALLASLTNAHAQSAIDRDSRPELRLGDRGDDKQSPSISKSKDFEVGLTLPVRYSSNVANAAVDSLVTTRGDWYASPEAYVKWSRQYEWAKLSAEVGAGLERYAVTQEGDIDSLYATFKIAKTDGEQDLFVPYAMLRSSMYFEPTFKSPEISYNDFSVGFSSGIAWRDRELIPYIDSLIRYTDAAKPGDVSLLFDARVGRRMTDTIEQQNTFVSLRVELGYVLDERWSLELSPRFRARFYENYHGEQRIDYRPEFSATLNWKPEWLKAFMPRAQLSFGFDTYRNYSNIPGKTYSLWSAGPILELRAKF